MKIELNKTKEEFIQYLIFIGHILSDTIHGTDNRIAKEPESGQWLDEEFFVSVDVEGIEYAVELFSYVDPNNRERFNTIKVFYTPNRVLELPIYHLSDFKIRIENFLKECKK